MQTVNEAASSYANDSFDDGKFNGICDAVYRGFLAGAAWQREQDAKIAESAVGDVFGHEVAAMIRIRETNGSKCAECGWGAFQHDPLCSKQECPCGVCAVCTAEMDANQDCDFCHGTGEHLSPDVVQPIVIPCSKKGCQFVRTHEDPTK